MSGLSHLNLGQENNPLITKSVSSSAFGDNVVVALQPKIQLTAPYGIIDTGIIETFNATGGTVDVNNNLFRCQTGTSVGGYGVIRSSDVVHYKAGEGMICRLTAKFTTGIPLSLQFAGFFSLTETLAFGYDGDSFGIIHEYDGQAEVQTIQVTGAASGSESATITLDGDSATASLTATTVQGNAFQIARDLAADATLGAKWRFEQVDDSVKCISKSVGDKTGTFSFSSSTATATITENTAGALKTKDFHSQSEWNLDTASWLIPTNINIYQLQYGYLGSFGGIFSVFYPETGSFVNVHRIKWANSKTTANFGNPSMKVGWTSASLGSSGTNLTVEGASAFGGIEGITPELRPSRSLVSEKTGISTTSTNILTLKNRIVYGERFNLGDIRLVSISIDNDHNKGIIVQVLKNPDVAGTPNFQYVDENLSLAEYDTSGTTVTNGLLINSFAVEAQGSVIIDLLSLTQIGLPEDRIVFAARTLSGTATKTTATVNWYEEI